MRTFEITVKVQVVDLGGGAEMASLVKRANKGAADLVRTMTTVQPDEKVAGTIGGYREAETAAMLLSCNVLHDVRPA